jgi:hypothetical protein
MTEQAIARLTRQELDGTSAPAENFIYVRRSGTYAA